MAAEANLGEAADVTSVGWAPGGGGGGASSALFLPLDVDPLWFPGSDRMNIVIFLSKERRKGCVVEEVRPFW